MPSRVISESLWLQNEKCAFLLSVLVRYLCQSLFGKGVLPSWPIHVLRPAPNSSWTCIFKLFSGCMSFTVSIRPTDDLSAPFESQPAGLRASLWYHTSCSVRSCWDTLTFLSPWSESLESVAHADSPVWWNLICLHHVANEDKKPYFCSMLRGICKSIHVFAFAGK